MSLGVGTKLGPYEILGAAGGGSEYRRIHVTTTGKDLKVQAKESYYASRQMAAKPGQ
jgi:hypothetical protein